jgi:outer membrane biosynthesis protein TonB
VLAEYGKRLKARKDSLANAFNSYQNNVFSKRGLELTCMWAQYGGWWYITDSSPPPPPAKPAPAKPAPAKPAPAPTPIAVAIPAQMKPQAMPAPAKPVNTQPSGKAVPTPAKAVLPPDELLTIELISIPAKYLPAAGADYEEMMFGMSDDDDAESEDMP